MATEAMRRIVAPMALALTLMAAGGCSDEKKPDDMISPAGPLAITEIIATPKAPAPLDTVTLTAIITSSSSNVGDFPTVQWTADTGTFINNATLTVLWIAPPAGGLGQITCRATNKANSVSRSVRVFVGQSTPQVPIDAGAITMQANGTDFFYLRTTDVARGATLYQWVAGATSPVIVGTRLGKNFAFSQDLSKAAYSADSTLGGTLSTPVLVFHDDLVAKTSRRVASVALKGISRWDQFTFPNYSPDGNIIVFQAFRPAPQSGDIDSFDVWVHYVNSGSTVSVTETHGPPSNPGRRRNYFPTISSDGEWCVFVSDRTGTNRWDYYGLKIAAGVIPTDSASTRRLTTTDGLAADGTANTIKRPVSAWNPSAGTPVLASIGGGDAVLRLIAMNGTGAVVTAVSGFAGTEKPRELAWSRDGAQVAVSTSAALYTVSLGGAVTKLHLADTGDVIQNISWSFDGRWIVYRLVRGGLTWMELINVDGTSLSGALILTPALGSGNLSKYVSAMRMNAPWNSADQVFMPMFKTGQTTPEIRMLDLSGITSP